MHIRGIISNDFVVDATNLILEPLEVNNGDLSWTEIDSEKLAEIDLLVENLIIEQDDSNHQAILDKIVEITKTNEPDIIPMLFETMFRPSPEDSHRLITWVLAKIFWQLRRNHYKRFLNLAKDFAYLLKSRDKSMQHPINRKWVAMFLMRLLRGEQFTIELAKLVIADLKDYVTQKTYTSDPILYMWCHNIILRCEQLPYPIFYQAWHSPSLLPSTQSLNLANLPQLLHAAIKDDRTLNQTVHLICIDTNKFIDLDNPSSKIYTEMVKAGCPKSKDGTPKTMGELQAYWDLLEYDKRIVLVFYDLATPTPQGFSDTFINALSKFDGEICIVTSQSIANIPLQQFHPDQPQLICDIVKWISAIED